MNSRPNSTQKEVIAEMVVEEYCPHHKKFEESIEDKLELIENKVMGMCQLFETKWNTIVSDSQMIILEHINDLKGMVTSFMKRNSDDIVRVNADLKQLNNRVASIENQIHTFLKKTI